MLAPPSVSFFPPGTGAQSQEFFQMIGPVLIELTLGQEIQVLLDEAFAPPYQKGDLAYLHLLLGQMNATNEGGQIVAHRLGAVAQCSSTKGK